MRTDLVPVEDLDPRQREAVRLYTDPLLPTFGNKTQAALAAGYDTTRVFDTPAVAAEVARIEEQRALSHAEVREFMGDFAHDAARALVKSLGLLNSLTIEDPNSLLGEPTQEELDQALTLAQETAAALKEGSRATVSVGEIMQAIIGVRLSRADAMTKANRVGLQAFKEAREAAELLLRYALGHPEQTVRHKGRPQDVGPVDLSDLSQDELQQLGTVIQQAIKDRQTEVVEAEVEFEDEEPTG